MINLAGQGLNVVPSQTGGAALPGWAVSLEGVAGRIGGINSAAVTSQFTVADQGVVATGDCAFRVRFIYNNFLPTTTGGLLSRIASGNRELFLMVNENTGFIAQINMGNTFVSGPLGNTIPLHVVQDIVVTRTGGVGAVYQQGVATATGLALAGTTTAPAPLFIGGDGGNGATTPDAFYLSVQTWTRNITAAEALQLWLDPYCFLTTTPLQATLMTPGPPPLILMGQIWI